MIGFIDSATVQRKAQERLRAPRAHRWGQGTVYPRYAGCGTRGVNLPGVDRWGRRPSARAPGARFERETQWTE
jgi:hypothetical protein